MIGVDEVAGSNQDQGSTINSCQLQCGGEVGRDYRNGKRIDQKGSN